jgi:hypothetical protein
MVTPLFLGVPQHGTFFSRAVAARLAALAGFLCLFGAVSASALPLYTAREGRTCDNCHTLPNSWKNPENIRDRKCHMSCAGCHVDPTGGGLRTTPGRFFGQSTLPMAYATHRGYKDTARFLAPGLALTEARTAPNEAYRKARSERDLAKRVFEDASRAASEAAALPGALSVRQEEAAQRQAASQKVLDELDQQLRDLEPDEETTAPNPARESLLSARSEAAQAVEAANRELDEAGRAVESAKLAAQEAETARQAAERAYQEKRAGVMLSFQALNEAKNWFPTPIFGTPFGERSPMSYDQARYGGMKADPLLSLGLDARLATWTAESFTQVFPMQFDTQAAVQPVEHLTAYVNAGVLASAQGFVPEVGKREHPYAIKDAFLMAHEFPFNSYVRAGSFIPQFGIRQDDHTAFNRRDFELDHGIRESRVFGVEVGTAPNYPYASVAVFRPNQRDQFGAGEAPFFGVSGIGAAFNLGYRELGWQIGASFLTRRRALEDGGDSDSLNLQWGFNPWFYSDLLPLTYLGEYSLGTLQRPISGLFALQAATSHELSATVSNGLVLRAKYDWSDTDFAVRDDEQHRFSFGADLTVIPGVRVSAVARTTLFPGGDSGDALDFLTFLRLWL